MPTRVLGWPAFSPRTGNPYNGLFSSALVRRGARVEEFTPARLLRGRYDVWHVHWPERIAHGTAAVARLAAFAVLVLWAKARGTRIVWTVHNLEGHARRHPQLERRFMRWLTRRLDGIVCLSETGARLTRARYPVLREVPATVIALGHYIGHYPNEVGRERARATLGLDPAARVLVFVGRILPYKNVERLVEQARRLADPNVRLVVAGLPAPDELRGAIEEAARGDNRVHLDLRDVGDDELQVFLNAADLVVLPFERILNSSTALLALSFGRPVLVPRTGAMEDLQTELGADAVHLYPGPLSAAHLEEALAAAAPDPGALLDRVRAKHDWDVIADRTISLYEQVESR